MWLGVGRRLVALEVAALVAAAAVAVARSGYANWDGGLAAVLLVLAIASDLTAVETASQKIRISGSFLAIVVAIVLLGSTPAALIALGSIAIGWFRTRYAPSDLLINLVTYAWFPLLGGIAFREGSAALGLGDSDGVFYLLVFALFCFALLLNFALIAGYSSYVEGGRIALQVRRALVPILPSELASALLAVGTVFLYVEAGLAAIAMLGVILLTFQYLLGALLLSQQRADELDLRARQLAGFQTTLLSALLRTLDLRDRMTARHSAAVARYSRDIAVQAGLGPDEQELAHTAGLLHDIGKFVFPDELLTQTGGLSEDDWEQLRRHPYEGARIVSQVDGYGPVGEIILAHHERMDGLGYPRGLSGEQIPPVARVIAVADAYDVLTARDSYKRPLPWDEAVEELRRGAGTQFDGRFVDALVEVLEREDLSYRHGEDVDLEAELTLGHLLHPGDAPAVSIVSNGNVSARGASPVRARLP